MNLSKCKGEKICHVRFPVFSYNVFVIFTNDINKSRNRLSDILGQCSIVDNTTQGLHSHNEESSLSVIFLKKRCTYGTVAHECYHALCAMFEYAGAMIEEEVMAYHLSYLVDEITKK